ncbi:GcrA family cell cycle regulator [Asticcacaulis sp. ZE23SCel15]|uniref:GcrA family cell cycle regulator n=1 Tax=Asticcacaulis sp. ZE23SCel15 TaxID=3059027 RepID=UPI00265ED837|nr:GcrA family cell cycle regulator [Asticcacaulis sp. ZE23SCel15]WKL57260.1 GcrA family cell cycle regulator [Asticcacaulis sp. ZE23SCel15]
MSWSDKIVTIVAKLWADGVSAGEIVKVLRNDHGVVKSRNAVIGVLDRRGLRQPPSRVSKARVVDTVRPAACVKAAGKACDSVDIGVKARVLNTPQAQITLKPVYVGVDMGPPEDDQTAIMLAMPAPDARGVSIMALEAGMCRFIIDDRGGASLYCGLPVAGRRVSYCAGCRTGELNRGRNGHKKPLVADPARSVTVSDSVAGYARIGSGRLPPKAGGLFHEWG